MATNEQPRPNVIIPKIDLTKINNLEIVQEDDEDMLATSKKSTVRSPQSSSFRMIDTLTLEKRNTPTKKRTISFYTLGKLNPFMTHRSPTK